MNTCQINRRQLPGDSGIYLLINFTTRQCSSFLLELILIPLSLISQWEKRCPYQDFLFNSTPAAAVINISPLTMGQIVTCNVKEVTASDKATNSAGPLPLIGFDFTATALLFWFTLISIVSSKKSSDKVTLRFLPSTKQQTETEKQTKLAASLWIQ